MKLTKFKYEKILNWALGIFVALAILRFVSTPENAKPSSDQMDFSTFIPKGFVLVPIELANSLSLEGVLGAVGGHVDLYESVGSGSGKQIANHVKILRAPNDPRQFAVLVKEHLAPAIVKHPGPLIATIRNPQDQTISRRTRGSATILYGGEIQ